MTCRLAAGMGQGEQMGVPLTVTKVIECLFWVIPRKLLEDAAQAPWLSDQELYFHLTTAGVVTRGKRDSLAVDKNGRSRTPAEVKKALV